jgi:predicted GIY-YIG superfamily endonuclease
MLTVYFLVDGAQRRGRKSYIGYTVNLPRRLRQHRGELAGGAKYTRGFKDCRLLAHISGFPNKRLAMSYEWHAKRKRLRCHASMLVHREMQHPRLARFFAPLAMAKFSSLCIHLPGGDQQDALERDLRRHYCFRNQGDNQL